MRIGDPSTGSGEQGLSPSKSADRTALIVGGVAALAIAYSTILDQAGLARNPIAIGVGVLASLGTAGAFIAERMPVQSRWAKVAWVAILALLTVAVPAAAVIQDQREGLLLSEHFSHTTNQWRADTTGRGRYLAHGYTMSLETTDDGSLERARPQKAKHVDASTPQSVRVETRARRTSSVQPNAGFGIICGAGVTGGYMLGIWERREADDGWIRRVEISKYVHDDPFYIELQKERLIAVDPGLDVRLRADCTYDSGTEQLKLYVNGRLVADATDKDNPFAVGTVGLGLATGPGINSIQARFDDFVVRRVAGTPDRRALAA